MYEKMLRALLKLVQRMFRCPRLVWIFTRSLVVQLSLLKLARNLVRKLNVQNVAIPVFWQVVHFHFRQDSSVIFSCLCVMRLCFEVMKFCMFSSFTFIFLLFFKAGSSTPVRAPSQDSQLHQDIVRNISSSGRPLSDTVRQFFI